MLKIKYFIPVHHNKNHNKGPNHAQKYTCRFFDIFVLYKLGK